MDTLSHGLWGSLAFGRKNKKRFWLAFFFGVAPDLFSFGPFFVSTFLGLAQRPAFGSEPPLDSAIPRYVHTLYNYTHSLIIFAAVFLLVWLIRKKPLWAMMAWPLHILYDIPLDTEHFFPTPFLWPFFSYRFNGWNWGNPWIFFTNEVLLALGFGMLFRYRRLRGQSFYDSRSA